MQLMLPWKSHKHYIFWLCFFRLRHPACNPHAPYCCLWPDWYYIIFHFIS